MDDFIIRLENEFKELQEKTHKLEQFILSNKFGTVNTVQQSLLNIQLDAMKTYKQCLTQRLNDLT